MLQTNEDNFGLIISMRNGGVIKNLTIESSSMSVITSNTVKNFGFFVGRASASNTPEAGTGNITISDCHSINNTITITGISGVENVGFIAGNLVNNEENGPYIFVSDCSTKYSNFTSSNRMGFIGGNFGYVSMNFFTLIFFFLFLFFQNRIIICFNLTDWN